MGSSPIRVTKLRRVGRVVYYTCLENKKTPKGVSTVRIRYSPQNFGGTQLTEVHRLENG